MQREDLNAFLRALVEPSFVVSAKGEVFAANAGGRSVIGDGTLMSRTSAPDELADFLRLCARSSDPLPGVLRIGEEGSEPVVHACRAGLLSRAEGERPALVLVRMTPKENSPFLQLNQTIAQLTEEIRRRRDAEDRLRVLHEETKARGEERFRLLVESVKDYAIFILDPEGRVTTWNPGAERIKGYGASEIIGKHFSIFYPREDADGGKCDRELAVATCEGRFEEEGWRVRKDGSLFWARVTITSLRDPAGKLIGFAKVTRDLTERNRTEEELRRLAAEKAALAEKASLQEFQELFLAILGHDLRNPLAAIDMGAGILRQRAEKACDEVATRVLDRMKSSSERMTRMIEQILDLTRSRIGGGLEVKVAAMDLSATLAAIVDELRTANSSRVIALHTPANVVGAWDRDRLEQVFSNLIGNAIHHGAADEPVTVVTQVQNGDVRVSVHNGGPPIPETLRAKLFSPFRRGARDSRTARTAGLGLGLYICRELVLAHGGEIRVRSASGEGTAFEVFLPRAPCRFTSGLGEPG